MNDRVMKSYRFREEREADWQALDRIVTRAEKRGVKRLSDEVCVHAGCAKTINLIWMHDTMVEFMMAADMIEMNMSGDGRDFCT